LQASQNPARVVRGLPTGRGAAAGPCTTVGQESAGAGC
jgi:hypothetical protein